MSTGQRNVHLQRAISSVHKIYSQFKGLMKNANPQGFEYQDTGIPALSWPVAHMDGFSVHYYPCSIAVILPRVRIRLSASPFHPTVGVT